MGEYFFKILYHHAKYVKVYPAWFKKTNTCVVFASILYKCLFSNPLASFNSLNWRVSCVFRSCKWGSSIQRG